MTTKRTFFTTLRLFSVVALLSLFQVSAHAQCAYYVQNNNPWGQGFNQTAMDQVYGAGGWTQYNYTNAQANAAAMFSPATCLVFLEGSDGNAIAMDNFITTNISAIETWVAGGGRLFFNAAPNQGGPMNWGFNGTTCDYNYGPYSSTGNAISLTHPIFLGPYLPTAATYTGNYFSHARILGTNLTNILYGDAGTTQIVLADVEWGAGIAFFGGMTQPNWWQPQPQGPNLWYNILYYIATIQLESLDCSVNGTNFCGGTVVPVSYTSSQLTINAGNTFSVELSDALGSFATPTVIGAVNSVSPSGTINATIPGAVAPGTAYRVRVTASNAAYVGNDNGTDLTMNPVKDPMVQISASPNYKICRNTNVTFTAVPTNGGTPSYQWYLNGLPVGTNSDTYTSNTFADGDEINCFMTSTLACVSPATVGSNFITMVVSDPKVPTIIVSSMPSDTICPGTPINFSTTVTNQGAAPVYQWSKNGNPVGTNQGTYLDDNMNAGDVVNCTITSSAACVLPAVVTSSNHTIFVKNTNSLAGNVNYPEYSAVMMANHTYPVCNAHCDLMATITPSGAQPLYGNTVVRLGITQSVQTYNQMPYVQRHVDIDPDNHADIATATITVYAKQQEFDNYNVVAAAFNHPSLPTSSTDAANISNVRIAQFHGTGNVPNNYTGSNVTITPTSVVWNATNNWWEITFPVTGFSGFYIFTDYNSGQLGVNKVNAVGAGLEAFPNPVQDVLSVKVNGTVTGKGTLTITDIAGKTIQSVPLTTQQTTTDINMNQYANGMYMLKFVDDKRSEQIKITKQ